MSIATMKQCGISQSTLCVPCCLVMSFLLYSSQKCYANKKLLEDQHQKSTTDGLECESTQDTVDCETTTGAPLCVADGCVTGTTISEPSTPPAVTHSPSQVSPPPSITTEPPETIAPATAAIAQVPNDREMVGSVGLHVLVW